MTNKELANAIINNATANNVIVDMTEKQLVKIKKDELETLGADLIFNDCFDFNVYDEYEQPIEQPKAEQTANSEQPKEEQTAEQPKIVFKKTAKSVFNFEQLLDTLTAYNLAVSYTNRRIVTDAMLFCKRAKYIARVYVKNSYETLIDDMLTEYDGYKGYYDIKDNDDLDIVIVALQSATRLEKKRVTKAVADRVK